MITDPFAMLHVRYHLAERGGGAGQKSQGDQSGPAGASKFMRGQFKGKKFKLCEGFTGQLWTFKRLGALVRLVGFILL